MDYKHRVQYYETDKMGITHHSNYIRWMEEARVAYLSEVGWDYARLESLGVVSPVVAVNCRYVQTTTFFDVVTVEVGVDEFRGVRLKMKYIMKNEQGEVVCDARSEHCFLDREGNPIRLKKDYPEFYDILSRAAEED
ncbi:MAG: acyl-CoA thioesterase [Eubacterium sp.]|nr:acyl-CoA thioesterase [Eubacterium sp.]